jgi:hypothetical protein
VLEFVKFVDIEVFTDFELEKNGFVVMEGRPGGIESGQRLVAMSFEVSVIDKVQDRSHSALNGGVGSLGQYAQKDFLHVFSLIPGPLRGQRYALFEVAETGMGSHCAEPTIYFAVFAGDGLGRPLDNMIPEDAIVQLVEKVGSHRREYVAVREISPEGIYGSQILINKFDREFVLGLVNDDPQGLPRIAQRGIDWLSPLLGPDEASRARILSAARNEALLRIVRYVSGKNREHSSHVTIRTVHLLSIHTRRSQGLEDHSHAVMKELVRDR